MSDFLSRLNPFFKFIFVFAVSTALAFTRSVSLNLDVLAACAFLLLIGARPARWLAAGRFLIPVFLIAFSVFMTGYRFGNNNPTNFGLSGLSATAAGMNLATRFLAFAGLGIAFSVTTNPYELIKSMRRNAKLPRKFAYGMLCAINLMPYLKNEYDNSRLAFRVRGVKVSAFSPKPIFSMLANCFRWSEVLSMAMFSKGFYEE